MIVVTGPPRTGTSLVTEVLYRLGFDLGPESDLDLRRFHENPRGKYESLTAVDINKRLIHRYRDPNGVMPWEPELEPEEIEAIRGFRPEVVKDPRFCYTLGAWIRAGKRIDHVIWCWRHPAAILRSFAAIHPGHRFLKRGPVDHAGHLVQWLLAHDLPFSIVRFPRSAKDPGEFAFLADLAAAAGRKDVTPDRIQGAHSQASDPGIVRFGP